MMKDERRFLWFGFILFLFMTKYSAKITLLEIIR